MADTPNTLTADSLCQLTGLTDRRHRQIAEAGYFPPPKESQYQMTKTIQGMFRYYRELSEKSKAKVSDVKAEKTNREIKLLDLQIGREEKKYVARAEVDQLLLHVSSLAKATLYPALERELPPKAEGRTAQEISLVGRKIADRICEQMRSDIEAWEDEP